MCLPTTLTLVGFDLASIDTLSARPESLKKKRVTIAPFPTFLAQGQHYFFLFVNAQVDGTWNVPTTLTLVSCVLLVLVRIRESAKIASMANSVTRRVNNGMPNEVCNVR
jgi:hypothetical protein